MTTWPGTIAAITLVQEDLAAATAFYRAVFEAEVVFSDDASAVFRFGPTLINLLDASAAPELVGPAPVGVPDAGPRAVMSLEVDDVDLRAAAVVAAGATLLNGPVDRPWGIRTASFRDPGGHVWELGGPIG